MNTHKQCVINNTGFPISNFVGQIIFITALLKCLIRRQVIENIYIDTFLKVKQSLPKKLMMISCRWKRLCQETSYQQMCYKRCVFLQIMFIKSSKLWKTWDAILICSALWTDFFYLFFFYFYTIWRSNTTFWFQVRISNYSLTSVIYILQWREFLAIARYCCQYIITDCWYKNSFIIWRNVRWEVTQSSVLSAVYSIWTQYV